MSAMMVVYMDILDEAWVAPYLAEVPDILSRHGAVCVAASREVRRIEGAMLPPERMAIFRFPSLEAIDRFMADESYRPLRDAREAGAASRIFIFENAVTGSTLI